VNDQKSDVPEMVGNEQELDELLSVPTAPLVEMMKRLDGDIMVLGIGGKMGPTVGRMAHRAIQQAGVGKRVIGVSRFSNSAAREQLERAGIETRSCDLLDPEATGALPDVKNIIFMVGRKFGTSAQQELTWASNALVPGYVAHRFRQSRIVAFSTGCVYPLVAASTGGCTEETSPDPVGEYSQSCLARERIFDYYSKTFGTSVLHLRLNYAIDLRYGVIHDIARKILQDEVIDLTVGHFNAIWQGDAANVSLLALEHCNSPPDLLNVTGAEILSVQGVAEQLGRIMQRQVRFVGDPGSAAYLSNPSKAVSRFGQPPTPLSAMVRWTAHWLMNGGKSLDKPTHFEVTSGKY